MENPPSSDAVRVGVLSHHNSKETKAILNAVDALGHEPVWIRETNFHSTIDDDGLRVRPAVDVLANRLLLTKSRVPLAKLRVARLYAALVPVLNPPPAVLRAIDKYRAAVHLRAAGIRVPDAYLTTSPHHMDDWTTHIEGSGVQKPAVGTNGHRLALVEPGDPGGRLHEGGNAFVQEFIETPTDRASDVRVYVVAGEIVGAMRRSAQHGEWRANVSRGADVEDVTAELSPLLQRIARDAVATLGLDYGGVDLIHDGDEWYVLEVNATAGFKGLYRATGRSVAPRIAEAAIERAGGRVDSTRVSDLAATLDDSIPDCKPDHGDSDGPPTVLGYTNRVRVSGRSKSETVIAKADTGAKRTSIDAALAGQLGLGPITGTTTVRSGTTGGSNTRPLVEIECLVGGRWQTTTASIADRSHMQYPMLLGRDVLADYRLDIQQRVDEE